METTECVHRWPWCGGRAVVLLSAPMMDEHAPACFHCANVVAEIFGLDRVDAKDAGRSLPRGRYKVKRVWLTTKVLP